FRSKARSVESLSLKDSISIDFDSRRAVLALLRVKYEDQEDDTYLMAFTYAPMEEDEEVMDGPKRYAVASMKLRGQDEQGLLYDAFVDEDFSRQLLQMMARGRGVKGRAGRLQGTATRDARRLMVQEAASLPRNGSSISPRSTVISSTDPKEAMRQRSPFCRSTFPIKVMRGVIPCIL
ncbi:MAG: hypothetical protein P8181_09415, partial [bacterium]